MKRLLWLLVLCAVTVVPALAQGGTIDFGDKVEGELTRRAATAEYTFEGEEGQLVLITLTADEIDTFLVLDGPDGTEIATDDDSGPGMLDSRIGPLSLTDTGAYTITVTSYSAYSDPTTYESGKYELELDTVTGRRIEYTQDVKGELTADDTELYYTFRGQAGDLATIQMSSNEFDTYITLSQGSAILYSGDSSISTEGIAQISGFALPETGDYLITAGSLYGDGVGEFNLSVNRAAVTDLSFDTPIEVELTATNSPLFFRFEGEASEVVNVRVRAANDLDTTMTINGPDGYQVAYADDTVNTNPEIRDLILPQSGAYSVLVAPYSAGGTDSITITLERGEIMSLDEGAQTINFSAEETSKTVSFTGAAGEVVRLVLDIRKGEYASPSITVTQNQASPVYASASGVRGASFDFVVPEDGLVFVKIEDYSYSDVIYEVSVKHMDADAATDAASG